MQTFSKVFIATLLFSLTTFTHLANATDCYEQSPNLTKSEDEYYNLEDSIELSNQKEADVKAFLKKLSGKWNGELIYTECRGPDNAPEIIKKNASITSKNMFSADGKLKINIEKDYTEKRITSLENLSIINTENTFDLAFTDNNHLVFSERYRRLNAIQKKTDTKKASSNTTTIVQKISNYLDGKITRTSKKQPPKKRTSRITETIYDIALKDGVLTLIRADYTNGVYVSEEKWVMRR